MFGGGSHVLGGGSHMFLNDSCKFGGGSHMLECRSVISVVVVT